MIQLVHRSDGMMQSISSISTRTRTHKPKKRVGRPPSLLSVKKKIDKRINREDNWYQQRLKSGGKFCTKDKITCLKSLDVTDTKEYEIEANTPGCVTTDNNGSFRVKFAGISAYFAPVDYNKFSYS